MVMNILQERAYRHGEYESWWCGEQGCGKRGHEQAGEVNARAVLAVATCPAAGHGGD